MPMLSHVRALAEEIGPRGTGTPGEAAAADYVAERISALGLPVEWQTIRTSDSPLRPLLPQVTSLNVVMRVEPQGELR